MADSKISNLDALAAVDLDTTNDLVAVVDTSATQTKKISVGEVLGNLSTLNAIDTSITATAVDVFVYDTSKDSDGGAWRKRCQHTSWYNETLNTATRGSRREFPAVAVIVAEADTVTIYDGDDPALPMWMVFNEGTDYFLDANTLSIAMLNGSLCVSGNGNGLVVVDFLADAARQYHTTGLVVRVDPTIVKRNTAQSSTVEPSIPLVNQFANDVAMTVLPDAPTDSATGLPVPTIAVATDGNGTYSTSVITDDGTVYDIASDSTGTAVSVAFDGVSLSAVRSDGTVYVWDDAGGITADGVSPDATYSASSTPTLLGTVSKVAA